MNGNTRNSACVLAFSALLVSALSPAAHGMAPGTANAPEHTQMAAGVDVAGQLPVGDFADAVGFGLGALGRFEYMIHESAFGLTARAGYIWHLDKDNGPLTTSFSQVPLLVGGKYSLTGAPIYVGAEVGAIVGMTKVEGGFGGDTDDSETNFGFTVGAGYELGPTDIRISLNMLDASNMADAMTVGISFGYNFWGM